MKELLERCGSGDEQAIATLVQRYRTRAVELASALLHDDNLAQDAVQESFLSALRHLGELREPDAFWGWFRQIVRTQCNRLLRKTREIPDPEAGETAAANIDGDAGCAGLEDLRERVREAFARLAGASKEAAELFYLDELPCADIAQRLGVPEGTVKRRLHDARRTLRILLLGRIPAASHEKEQQYAGRPGRQEEGGVSWHSDKLTNW